jgi:hypothetical protein
MSADPVYGAFLRRQREEGTRLAEASDVLRVMALPDPSGTPCRYAARFCGRHGLVQGRGGAIELFDTFDAMIWFPPDYLRRVAVADVLSYMGPHPNPWHPNIRPPFVCAHIEPGTGLVDLLHVLHEMWTWNLWATGDEGLNHAASQWARRQDPGRFPIDRRPLKRRSQAPREGVPSGRAGV